MDAKLIYFPLVGMMLLTLVVWIVMFKRRITAIRTLGLNPSTRADLDKFPAPAVNASNNLQNLFELPVVFYAVVLAIAQTGHVDSVHVACAFGFLVFRVAHSTIHCTYNHVMQRFSVYAVAGLCLWTMVVRFAFALVTG